MVTVSETDGAAATQTTAASAGTEPETEADTETELRDELARLREQNRRLRAEYDAAQRRGYRRSALGMAALGVLALVGAAAFPVQATVLIALGGTGLFAAVLTYYLTPERFVAVPVGERINQAHTRTVANLVDELGLSDDRWYVPTPERPEYARLFIPQQAGTAPPTSAPDTLVISEDPDQRGLAIVPTGDGLYEYFLETVSGQPATEPVAIARQVADAVVESFELADAAGVDPDREGGRIAIQISEPVYGDLSDPDHPIISVLAVGVATGISEPVRVEVLDDEWSDGLVVLEF